MCAFQAIHMTRLCLPDGRLANVRTNGDGLLFEYRKWHAHPALVRQLDELSRGIAESGVFDFDPLGSEPFIEVWYERVPGDLMGDRIMVPRISGRLYIELQCRAELIDPEVVREINEEVMPSVLGMIVPVMHAAL